MTEKDYSHRSTVEKLGIEHGMRVRITGDVGDELKNAAKARLGSSLLRSGNLDLIVRAVNSIDEADEFLGRIRDEMHGRSVVWIVTRKKGDPRYVKQEDLIPLGRSHSLVDNKTCSIDDQRSGIRFVVPKEQRG